MQNDVECAIPLSDSFFFSELEYLWNNELKIVYENDFIHIVYDGKLPDEDKVLKSLNLIKDRLIKIVWFIRNDLNNYSGNRIK